jgi:hypothetical protein
VTLHGRQTGSAATGSRHDRLVKVGVGWQVIDGTITPPEPDEDSEPTDADG